MELINKVQEILQNIEIENSIVDIHYDEQNHIIGFLTSNSFYKLNDFEAQNIIWQSLKNNLSDENLVKILGIFHETFEERLKRISINSSIPIKSHTNKLWLHKAPGNAKYWVLLDVAKFEEDFKSFFLIICGNEKFKNGLTFKYTKDVLDFMELENGEIYEELFANIFENSISEIKIKLMKKHDELTNSGLWGKNNRYNYVYENFKLLPFPIKKSIFNKEEINLFKKALSTIDNFSAKKIIEKQINISEQILNNRQKI